MIRAPSISNFISLFVNLKNSSGLAPLSYRQEINAFFCKDGAHSIIFCISSYSKNSAKSIAFSLLSLSFPMLTGNQSTDLGYFLFFPYIIL